MIFQVNDSPLLSTVLDASADLGTSDDSDILPKIMDLRHLGNWAKTAIHRLELSAAVQATVYHPETNQLTLTLAAPNPQQLDATPGSLVLTKLAERWRAPFQQAIAARVLQLEVQQQQAEQVLGQLDTAIAKLSPNNFPRQGALEAQRAIVLREKAELAFHSDYLADLERNLEQASRDLFPMMIIVEGKITQVKQSPLQVIAFALITGFIVATFVALVIEQWPRWQAELATANISAQTQSPSNGAELP
ncbi:MAG: hypothetical protein AAGG51_07515 [Cyanobacteria bacterium P01_G01_bin.54]